MSTESIAATLRAARELIADPSHWTTAAWARTPDGTALPSIMVRTRTDTVSYCALGAIFKVDGPHENAARDQLTLTSIRLFNLVATTVNDTLGHEAVLKLYDEAIADAEGTKEYPYI